MGKKILVVDDDPEILRLTEDALKKREYAVVTAANGARALEQLRIERPDIILADVLMPEMDGYSFYKALKNNPLLVDIPVLIITGRGGMEDTFKVLGVDGFITKPFTTEDLVTEIEHIFRLKEARQQTTDVGIKGLPRKILAVGSQKDILENMVTQARRGGYTIETALNGSDAIAKAIKFLPDITFIDVQLPDMTAAEAVDVMRQLPHLAEKPVVGYCYYEVTDLARPEIRQRVLKIKEDSDRIASYNFASYMGRYHHQLFIQTIVDHFQPKTKRK
jgi:CheY-like chemotaxis protein